MRAVVYERYGGPEVLSLKDVPVPTPAKGQVLVAVVATSLNLSDWETLRGWPAYSRIGGVRKPRRHVLGSDIAGRVTAIGPGVTRFAVGDEVYGDNLQLKGGFAEYAVAPESALALKPSALSFAEASTIPQAGVIAMQGVAGVGPGTRVLINGAGGGSGAFAIQLAKRAGAHVTAVDNASKLDFMRQLGADAVIDYRQDDFTRTGPYDLVHRQRRAPIGVRLPALAGSRRPLSLHRRHHPCGAPSPHRGDVSSGWRRSPTRSAGRAHGSRSLHRADRPLLAGEVDIHIDRTFTLEQTADALAYVGEGKALGKVVVTVSD